MALVWSSSAIQHNQTQKNCSVEHNQTLGFSLSWKRDKIVVETGEISFPDHLLVLCDFTFGMVLVFIYYVYFINYLFFRWWQ